MRFDDHRILRQSFFGLPFQTPDHDNELSEMGEKGMG